MLPSPRVSPEMWSHHVPDVVVNTDEDHISGKIYQVTLISMCAIVCNVFMKKKCKKGAFTNSVDPDETPLSAKYNPWDAVTASASVSIIVEICLALLYAISMLGSIL